MTYQRRSLDLDERYAALSNAGDLLEQLSQVVDFEICRAMTGPAPSGRDGAIIARAGELLIWRFGLLA